MDISLPSSAAPSLKDRSAFSGLSLQLQSTPPNKEKVPEVMEFSSLTARNMNTTFLDASSLLRPRLAKASPIVPNSLKTSLALNSPFRSISRRSQNKQPLHTPNASKRRPSAAASRRTPLTPKGTRKYALDLTTRRRRSSAYMKKLADMSRSRKKELTREESLIEALQRSTFTSPPRRARVDSKSPSIFQDVSQVPLPIPHIRLNESTPNGTSGQVLFMPDSFHAPQPDDEGDLFNAPPTPVPMDMDDAFSINKEAKSPLKSKEKVHLPKSKPRGRVITRPTTDYETSSDPLDLLNPRYYQKKKQKDDFVVSKTAQNKHVPRVYGKKGRFKTVQFATPAGQSAADGGESKKYRERHSTSRTMHRGPRSAAPPDLDTSDDELLLK